MLNRLKHTLLLSAAALLTLASTSVQAAESIKIGLVTSQTGPYAVLGEQVKRAVEFSVNEANANGGIDGRKVELKMGDTEGNPEAGRRAGEKLALGGHNILIGTISSAVGLALSTQLDRWDAMYVSVVNKSPKITGESCHARMFRANHTDDMDLAIVSPWLKEQTETEWGVLAADYVWGRGSAAGFKNAAAAVGKNVKIEVYPPLGTKDFAPYISQLMDSGVKGLWIAVSGSDAINLAKQARQFGVFDKIKVVGHNFAVSSTIKAVGKDVVGVWGNVNYSPTVDNAMNRAFVEKWAKAYSGDLPTAYEGEAYFGMQMIYAAVKKANSVKPGDISKVMSGLEANTIFGPAQIRAADHQANMPNYLGRVEKSGSGYSMVVKQTFSADVASPPPSGACKL